jgi:alkaline phosphatase
MMSDNLKKYTNWTAMNRIPDADKKKLQLIIEKMHQLQKPVRFWNAPDTREAWEQLIKLGTDYINTDHIPELAAFLNDK